MFEFREWKEAGKVGGSGQGRGKREVMREESGDGGGEKRCGLSNE